MTSLGVLRLQALLESTALLHASLDLDELLRHLLRSVMGRLVIGRALVAVEDGGAMRVAIVRGAPRLPPGTPFDEAIARDAGVELFLPIGDGLAPVGWLGIARPPGGLEPEEEEFLRALLGLAASGIANARVHAEVRRLNQRLDQKVQELETLLESARVVSSTLDPDEVARLLALTLAGQWAVGRYAVAAWRARQTAVMREKGIVLPPAGEIRVEVEALAAPARVDALPRGALQRALVAQQAAVVFPLRASDRTIGLAALGPRPGGLPYADSDLDFGAGLVTQAVLALHNAWNVREALERQKIEKELALAASIQRGLFPAELPRIDGFDVAARNRPARLVGGDYYDVLRVEGARHEYLLCVADVSGKGLPAALLMSTIQATLRALLGRTAGPSDLAASANALLHATTPGNQYVTAVFVALDAARGVARYANGGHTEAVILRRDGRIETLPATGLALGLFPGMTYEELTFGLDDGDLVAFYSDGVTEAEDRDEREFGFDRLAACLRESQRRPAGEIVDVVFDAVDRFVAGAPQHDDITLLVLERTGRIATR
jgi:sigma-B regulation protein RsbU (phosphoserine phosphatase)